MQVSCKWKLSDSFERHKGYRARTSKDGCIWQTEKEGRGGERRRGQASEILEVKVP